MSVAIFDVGKTLALCTHLDVVNCAYKKGFVSKSFLKRVKFLFLLHKLKILPDDKVGAISRYMFFGFFKGRRKDVVNKLLLDCFSEYIRPKLIGPMLDKLSFHLQRGDIVIIISALFEGVIGPLKELCKAHYAIFPQLEEKDGTYTGRIIGKFPYGKAKADMVKDFLKGTGLCLKESWIYADRYSDRFLLQQAAYPWVVNPDKKLRKLALKKGWGVYYCLKNQSRLAKKEVFLRSGKIKPKLVFFDIDGVLIKEQTQKILLWALYRRKNISFLSFLKIQLWFIAYKLGIMHNPQAIRKYALGKFKGWQVEEAKKELEVIFQKEIKPNLSKGAVKLLQQHKENGDLVILVSAAILEIADLFKEHLGADYCLATNLEVKEGRYTGRILGRVPYGKNKAEIVKDFVKRRNLSLQESVAYADHISDRFLLELVENPCTVNPKGNLRKLVKERGWQIYEF